MVLDRLMDAFSKILALARIEGILDLRCHMAGRFDLPHDQLPPGEAQFHLVLSGSTRLDLSDKQALDLETGDFVLLPRGAPHNVRGTGVAESARTRSDDSGALLERRNTEGTGDVDLLCGRFRYARDSGELIMSSLPDVLHVSFSKDNSIDALSGLVALLRAEVQLLRSGAMTVVTALNQVLFVMALRTYAQREGMPPSLLVLLGDPRLSRAVFAMVKEPEKAWTVEMLAERSSMSRATLARQFAQKGALSPLDLLTTIRVQVASQLLETTELPLGEIAERVGYQSESAFSKVFQKRTGLTPFGYRRNLRMNRRS